MDKDIKTTTEPTKPEIEAKQPQEAIPVPEPAKIPDPVEPERDGLGRPTKLDSLIVKKLEEAFAFDSTIGEACFYAGISRQTYYTWMEANPDLLDRFEELRNTPVLAARKKVINAINTDTDTAQWYLERKRKSEFAARTEHTGPGGKDLIPLTGEQEEKLDMLAGREVPIVIEEVKAVEVVIKETNDKPGPDKSTEGGN